MGPEPAEEKETDRNQVGRKQPLIRPDCLACVERRDQPRGEKQQSGQDKAVIDDCRQSPLKAAMLMLWNAWLIALRQ